ncbi:tRNA (adenine(22)-N(1))-methyltransferase TrmK [Shewanella sp. CG12_big_fil_rev_8_21_14_0_65_47_15]|uniref:tRNA (adenine(22)-N(1))-methyltransferase n=1 Tax=Shewanella sp. CG12_big_fil_rev_8_21_14_0_65_47_15 TaxID=1975537 RepID=UPI000CB7FC69|nr:tRNA (adenine(22)-N(1))-methyltransferase TrmK [Shewanella sp. CG12_big_fil_rev_8_21_14_0_65_47_15]PIW58661.1 MAG: SAM-dependent methyltransferase [Shewanella sp. CG12_big_fil_rev_8_21_14_0_65_47_15]
MKISQRLQQINSMITGHYDHIWDCCCDHGLLGMLLLERSAAHQVHFVDCVPSLMQALELRLQRFFPADILGQNLHLNPHLNPDIDPNLSCHIQWQVHCLDVAALPLAQTNDQDKQLIIIAGVGGELLVELVRAIVAEHPEKRLEFILCPVHHNYFVRQSLSELGLGLKSEHLLEENQRFYEILHVINDGNANDHRISPSGSLMWNNLRGEELALARRYLHKVISHYQRMPEDKRPLSIINAYQQQLELITGTFFT